MLGSARGRRRTELLIGVAAVVAGAPRPPPRQCRVSRLGPPRLPRPAAARGDMASRNERAKRDRDARRQTELEKIRRKYRSGDSVSAGSPPSAPSPVAARPVPAARRQDNQVTAAPAPAPALSAASASGARGGHCEPGPVQWRCCGVGPMVPVCFFSRVCTSTGLLNLIRPLPETPDSVVRYKATSGHARRMCCGEM